MAEYGVNSSFAGRIRHAGRAEKFVTLLLLFILLTAATASVSAVLTGPDWASLWESLFFGLLVGWLLAVFHWPAWRSALMVLILGVLFSLLFAAGLNSKILAVFDETFRLALSFLATLKIRNIDPSPLGTAYGQLFTSLTVVVGRVGSWLKDLVISQPNYDPVAAGIVWSFVVWLVAAWAGWIVEAAGNALAAVLPAVLLCLSTLSYVRSASATIYLLLGLTLVLIAVVQYDHREQVWAETRVAFPARKGRQVGNVSIAITFLLLILAAILSSISIQRIIHWTSQARGTTSREESGLAKSLGIVPAATPTPDSFSNIRSPGLPRELLIGSGPELSGEQVMSVQVSDLPSLMLDGQLPPLYWRNFSYDIYTGHGWSSSVTQQTQYQPGQPLQAGQLPGHISIREQISLVPGAEGSVYTAGEPVSINVSTNTAWRSSNDLFGIQATSSSYSVQSLVPSVNETILRQAGQNYPTWVVQRYMAVPSSVPARVKELAIKLTATEPSPYDRVRAIEEYLRQNYPYTLEVPRPPANQDLVDYFLFDLRKGYCDYYASAMVILSRSAGIPARLAIGYASGDYSLNSKRFLVTQAEAHSWPEVYFPGIGWVPFEPTAGLPVINRTTQPTQAAVPTPVAPVNTDQPVGTIFIGRYTGLILLAAVAVLGFAFILWDELRLARMKPGRAAAEVYRRLKRYGTRLGVSPGMGDTPYEFAGRLTGQIQDITGDSWMNSTGIETIDATQALIADIVRFSYRPQAVETKASAGIVSQWRALRWRLRLVWVLGLGRSTFHRGNQESLDGADGTTTGLDRRNAHVE